MAKRSWNSSSQGVGFPLLEGLRRLLFPSPLAPVEWRRWARPWNLSFWPFHLGILLMWISPVVVLYVGESRGLSLDLAQDMMVGVPNFFTLVVSIGFVLTWWPRSATQGTFAELLVTPTPPVDFVRSSLCPPRILLTGACAALVLLKPGADLFALLSGKSYLAGDWDTFLYAANCVLCAWYDLPILVWMFTMTRSPTRAIVLVPFVLLPLHTAFLVHAGALSGIWPVRGVNTLVVVACVLMAQVAIGVAVEADLPRRIEHWARESAERTG